MSSISLRIARKTERIQQIYFDRVVKAIAKKRFGSVNKETKKVRNELKRIHRQIVPLQLVFN